MRIGQRLAVLAERSGAFYGRKMRAGHVYAFAEQRYGFRGDGGPVSKAQFREGSSLTVDSAGNWVLIDTNNRRVRVVAVKSGRFYGRTMRALHVYTVTGTGSTLTDSGDGDQATRAELGLVTRFLYEPSGLAVQPSGAILLAELSAGRVLVIHP